MVESFIPETPKWPHRTKFGNRISSKYLNEQPASLCGLFVNLEDMRVSLEIQL